MAGSARGLRLRWQLERLDGIEPTTPLWKSGVLPLNYSRKALGGTLYSGQRRVKPAQDKGEEALFSFGRVKGSVLQWCYAGDAYEQFSSKGIWLGGVFPGGVGFAAVRGFARA